MGCEPRHDIGPRAKRWHLPAPKRAGTRGQNDSALVRDLRHGERPSVRRRLSSTPRIREVARTPLTYAIQLPDSLQCGDTIAVVSPGLYRTHGGQPLLLDVQR